MIYCIHNSYLADRGGVRIEIKANQDLVKTPLDLSMILLEECCLTEIVSPLTSRGEPELSATPALRGLERDNSWS